MNELMKITANCLDSAMKEIEQYHWDFDTLEALERSYLSILSIKNQLFSSDKEFYIKYYAFIQSNLSISLPHSEIAFMHQVIKDKRILLEKLKDFKKIIDNSCKVLILL